MGGIRDLGERFWKAEVDPLALAGHLVDWAVTAAPASPEAHAARAEVYDARALDSRALMTRGIFSAAARESAARASGEGELSRPS